MIEIVQAGQAGKTNLLFDMHRLRNRVFKEELGWDVTTTEEGLEVDQFDLPEAIYLLSIHNKRVVGTWRLLSSNGPTMIRDIWPDFLHELSMPRRADVWELSRFAVSPIADTPREAISQSRYVVAEMFCGLTSLCMQIGITELFTLYDDRIAKILARIDCQPFEMTSRKLVGAFPARVGKFYPNTQMLAKLRAATGLKDNFTKFEDVPPILRNILKEDRTYA